MKIEITPLDTLFFRDGKPFSMGEETWARGLFPPPPSVIYGALRTAYFGLHPAELHKAAEKDDPTQHLKIKTISLKIGKNLHFPLGADVVEGKQSEEQKNRNEVKSQYFLSPQVQSLALASSPFTYENSGVGSYLLQTDPHAHIENLEESPILSMRDLDSYLNPTAASGKNLLTYKTRHEYLTPESKTGIGRNTKTGSAEEGKLYRVEMLRMATHKRSVSIYVEFEGLELPSKGMIKLGGEAKVASYQTIDDLVMTDIPDIHLKSKQFRLYLATTAIFGHGWCPKGIDPSTLEGKINGIPLRLLGATTSRPSYLGGFDMKKRRYKAMKRSVSAGSVYFCELTEEIAIEELANRLHGVCISDDRPQEGFGLAFIGSLAPTA